MCKRGIGRLILTCIQLQGSNIFADEGGDLNSRISFVMFLWICGAILVWGTLQILLPRAFLPSSTLDTEGAWTFGQVLPIILLAMQIISFAEGYMSTCLPKSDAIFSNTHHTVGQKAEVAH